MLIWSCGIPVPVPENNVLFSCIFVVPETLLCAVSGSIADALGACIRHCHGSSISAFDKQGFSRLNPDSCIFGFAPGKLS